MRETNQFIEKLSVEKYAVDQLGKLNIEFNRPFVLDPRVKAFDD